MKKYRVMVAALLVALLGVMIAPVAAHATTTVRSGAVVSVGKNETVDSTAYLAGTTVTIAGNVAGDLYCAGQTIDITGTVQGDVICAGQTVNISGNVLGNVRVAGQTVTLSGPVARSVTAFGQTVTLTAGAVVNNDVTIYGSSLQLGGKVGRDAVFGGQNVTVEGTIGRDATVTDDQLTLGSAARVGGSLNYTSKNDVQVASGAVITGKALRHDPPQREHRQENTFAQRVAGVSYWFGAFLVFGLILLALAPRAYKNASHLMVKQGGWAMLAGIVTLLVTPIAAVLLMATIIGVPAGVAVLLLWLVMMVTSFVYSSYAIGEWVAAQASWKLKWPNAMGLVIGLVILALLMLIPVVGGLFGFLALVWGLGGQILLLGQHLKNRKGEPKVSKKEA